MHYFELLKLIVVLKALIQNRKMTKENKGHTDLQRQPIFLFPSFFYTPKIQHVTIVSHNAVL